MFEFRPCELEGRRVDSSHSAGFVRVDFLQKEGFSTFVTHCNYTVYSLSSPSVKRDFPRNCIKKLWCGPIALFGMESSSLEYWQRLCFCTVISGNEQLFLRKPPAYVGSICFKFLVLNIPVQSEWQAARSFPGDQLHAGHARVSFLEGWLCTDAWLPVSLSILTCSGVRKAQQLSV